MYETTNDFEGDNTVGSSRKFGHERILYFNGTGEFHRLDGIYVGVWVPSILALGAFLVAGQEKA